MAHYFPTRERFLEKARQGNCIPVYREVIADMETPVSAFRKVGESPFAFLLESVEGGENLGRYSFLGANPEVVFKSKGNEVEIVHSNGRRESFRHSMPLECLRQLLKNYTFVPDEDLPPFCGGAVGYMSYDEVSNLEPVPRHENAGLGLPDLYFMISDTLLIFDHVRHRVKILSIARVHNPEDAGNAYDEALQKINAIQIQLARHLPPTDRTVSTSAVEMDSNVSQDDFMEMVEKAKDYIVAGDAFQVVLSQRLHVPISCDHFDVYRSLRAINPSPYMFYLKFDQLRIAGSSPEILARSDEGGVQVRPIAGTRQRGKNHAEDEALEAELRADPKECAEHIMLVDLGRNDIGRVCEFGSVKVNDLMVVERYSHVMHLVSNVHGKLSPGLDAFDVLKATFPAGTLSGAPKIRAMQIINELENVSRGPYGGTVGYFSFNGNLDSCITIRTIVMQGDHAYVQAGAGIVADSDPQSEYRETLNKAGAMIRAIEMAEHGME